MKRVMVWGAAFLVAAAARGEIKRGVVPEDTYRIASVSDVALGPDGKTALYTLETADEKKNAFTHRIWRASLDGGAPTPFTREGTEASAPMFSADGKRVAFLAEVDGKPQIVVQRAGGRSFKPVTAAPEGVGAFDWSADGTWFVYTTLDPKNDPSASKDDEPRIAPWVVRRTQIQRDGVGFLEDRHEHLWLVRADGRGARVITSGAFDDGTPRFSPDGRWIAFVSNRGKDPDADDNTDIFAVRPDGTGLRVVAANPGPDEFPTWSHNGDRLAFVGRLRPNDYYQIARLMVVPADGGSTTDLTGSLDTWVAADSVLGSSSHLARLNWSRDDATIFTTIEHRGATRLVAVPSRGGAVRDVAGGPFAVDLARLSADGTRFVFARSDPTHPHALFTMAANGTGARPIAEPNASWLAGVALSEPRRIVSHNSAGDAVEAWLYPPVDFDPAKRYPMIVYIHGGPQGFDGDYFDMGLENQIFPARGWAVLRVNYRGSTSYGEAFCRSLWGDWHVREFEDLMGSVDEALKLPWLDGSRLGIGGWSYGGIMTIWSVGHTDRFKVGVPERFEVDYLSCFGEDQWFSQYLEEFGNPFEKADRYREKSPGTYAPRIKTRLHLISNEKDGNCPLPQAMQFYQRLRLLGHDPELVIYPGEPHVMGQPRHYVDRLQRLVTWFDDL